MANDQGCQVVQRKVCLTQQILNDGNQLCRRIGATHAMVMPRLSATTDGNRHHVGAGFKGQKFQCFTHVLTMAWRTPNKIPQVTNAKPTIKFHDRGSPKIMTAPRADKPGTTAVIMVDLTGP